MRVGNALKLACVGFGLGVLLRVVQMLYFFDYETGFYTDGGVMAWLSLGVPLAAAVAGGVLCFRSRRYFGPYVPRRNVLVGVVGLLSAAALLCCAGLVMNLDPPALPTVAASTAPDTTGISSNEDRVSFLSQYGWQVNQEPLVTEELTIPKEMDESYDEYLELQTAQGFDLTKYAGKRVKRYTYEITNYLSGETGVQANLLIYRDKVVGGEVLSPQMNGFVHGLSMPQG